MINISSQLGNLALEMELDIKEGKLTSLLISDKKYISTATVSSENEVNHMQVKGIQHKLKHYFLTATAISSVALLPRGTSFQKSVWNELCKIPLGETRTYGEIAKKLNSSARAVGNACRKNPIAIIIPCHRVVSATGIGGYAGKTGGKQLAIKRWLLNHEGVNL